MAINLLTKYHNQLVEEFGHDSYTTNKASNEFSFLGVKTIQVMNMVTVDPNIYNRTASNNRFGAVTNIDDVVQEMTLTQDPSYTKTIDRGDNSQQGFLKTAGAFMTLQNRQKMSPLRDKYNLKKWAQNAGQSIKLQSALSKSNIVSNIIDMEIALDNAGVPTENRWLYTGNTKWGMIRQASEWVGCDNMTRDMIIKGYKGNIGSMQCVFVPDSWMPTGVEMLAAQQSSVLAPLTLKTARILENAQGFDGPVIEVREIYDAFVLGAHANGVVALLSTAATKAETPTITYAANTGYTIATTTANSIIMYTTDGSDPRYSKSSKVYTAAVTGSYKAVNAVAYNHDRNIYMSDVAMWSTTSADKDEEETVTT